MMSSSSLSTGASFLLSLLSLTNPATAAEQQARRNLEYMEKNGVALSLITPAMFQADAVDEYEMSFLVPPPIEHQMECQVFRNASDFSLSQGIECDCDHIGWLDEGDWLAYDIPLNATSTTTTYNLTFSVASPLGDGGFRVEDYDTQYTYATVDSFPLTEDWNSYSRVTASLEINGTNSSQNVTLLIRSISAGWTFRDFCLQEVFSSTVTTPPTETVPTTMPSVQTTSSVPSTIPTLFLASELESVAPTQATTTFVPTVKLLPTAMPTMLESAVPTETTTSSAPTTAVSFGMPSDVPSSVPTIPLEFSSTKPKRTILPTYMPSSTWMPTISHTTLEPSYTYSPSVSDYPSSVPSHSFQVSAHNKKKEKKKMNSKKSKSSGKGSVRSGKGSTGAGKGSTARKRKGKRKDFRF